jgi:hypothetical protein
MDLQYVALQRWSVTLIPSCLIKEKEEPTKCISAKRELI